MWIIARGGRMDGVIDIITGRVWEVRAVQLSLGNIPSLQLWSSTHSTSMHIMSVYIRNDGCHTRGLVVWGSLHEIDATRTWTSRVAAACGAIP